MTSWIGRRLSRKPARFTGIYNKRYFMEQLALEFGFARRHQIHLALLMLDLDHFKSVVVAAGRGDI